MAARKRSRSDRRGNDHHTLGRPAWSAPTQPTQVRSKHFRKASRTITLVIKIDDEGKAARATTTSPGNMALGAISSPSSAYELRSICARSSAIEPNLTVPSGSLASIDPSV